MDTLADNIRVVQVEAAVRTLLIEDLLTKARKTLLVADLIKVHHLAHLQDITVLEDRMNLDLVTTDHLLALAAALQVVRLAVHPTHLLALQAALHLRVEVDLFTEDKIK